MPGSVICALEDDYGVAPTTGWESYGLNADTFKSKQDILQRTVIRPRSAAPLLAGRRIIDKGGEATIELDAGSNGLGIYLACAASTADSAVVMGGTDAFEQVFTWDADGPRLGWSLAAQVERDRLDGTPDLWDYTGGKPTGLEITQNNDGFLVLSMPTDFLKAQRLNSDPGRSFTDTAALVEFLYAWQDAQITLTPLDENGDPDGAPVTECLSSFSLNLPAAVNTEQWCLKRGTTKHEPTRNATPAPGGTLDWLYQHPRYYDAFRNGTPFALSADWLAPVAIEGSTFPSLTIDVGCIVFEEPNDPEAQVDGDTTQSMPFVVMDLDNGDPVVTWTQVTSDDVIFTTGS